MVTGGSLTGNGTAIRVATLLADPVDARLNWWGDSFGPYHPLSNPDGLGDAVSDHVLFVPWSVETGVPSPAAGLCLVARANWRALAALGRMRRLGPVAGQRTLPVQVRKRRQASCGAGVPASPGQAAQRAPVPTRSASFGLRSAKKRPQCFSTSAGSLPPFQFSSKASKTKSGWRSVCAQASRAE